MKFLTLNKLNKLGSNLTTRYMLNSSLIVDITECKGFCMISLENDYFYVTNSYTELMNSLKGE